MKYPINGSLERHLLHGCRIIEKQSVTYRSASGEYTHILVECPKNYTLPNDKESRIVKYISLEWGFNFDNPSWYEATYHYSNKSHSLKYFRDNLTEDRMSLNRKKANESV